MISLGRFEDDCATILRDGASIGWLERNKTSEFKSASSRAQKTRVASYTVWLSNDKHAAAIGDEDFATKGDALAAIRRVVDGVSQDFSGTRRR